MAELNESTPKGTRTIIQIGSKLAQILARVNPRGTRTSENVLIRRARIQLVLAISAGMRQLADAFIIIHEIDAGTTVLTRIVGAIVDVSLAVGAGITRQALAAIAV
jgi:hypothetical protein